MGVLPPMAESISNVPKKFGGVPKSKTLALCSTDGYYQYSISIKFTFRNSENKEVTIDFSNSKMMDPILLEQDKKRCERVYKAAVRKFMELRKGGWFFYDCQSTLYTTTILPSEKLSHTFFKRVSKRPNFVKAEFVLERKTDFYLKTFSNENVHLDKKVFIYKSSLHYKISDKTPIH
uniref:ArgoN domain-containing protein n=1 Tax=Caenorhabditis tropicalis TaxID=1561998 RepID=A0A1I7UM54_9PELO